MQNMVNKAYTCWMAAVLISGDSGCDLPRFAISVSILFRSLNRLPYAVGHARACTRCHVEF